MRLEADERSTVSSWDGELQCFMPKAEHVSRWIARRLDDARRTSPRPLEGLKVRVGPKVYEEMLKTLDREYSRAGLTHVYGAELEVDHELAAPFEITWVTEEEAALRDAQVDLAMLDSPDWWGRRFA